MNDRMSSAEYRLLAGQAAPPRHGSARSTEPNPYRGLRCPTCGQVVRASHPAVFLTETNPDGSTRSVSAKHLNCEVEASADALASSGARP